MCDEENKYPISTSWLNKTCCIEIHTIEQNATIKNGVFKKQHCIEDILIV